MAHRTNHYRCIAPSCKSDNLKLTLVDNVELRKITFHSIPAKADKSIRNRWLSILAKESSFVPSKNDRLCSLHFVGNVGPTVRHPFPIFFAYNNFLGQKHLQRLNNEISSLVCSDNEESDDPDMLTDNSKLSQDITMSDFQTDSPYCKGCYCKLQVGVIPEELLVVVPGINVWQKCSARVSNSPIITSQNNKNCLTLCLECFQGYASGTQKLSLDVLGVSIVTAPYTEEERYLKIEGPTKLVNLLTEEPEKKESNSFVENIDDTLQIPQADEQDDQTSKIPPVTRRRRKGKRRVVVQKVLEEIDVSEPEGNYSTETPTVITNPTDFLSVGCGALGAVEMTDDDYEEQQPVPVDLQVANDDDQDVEIELMDSGDRSEPKIDMESETHIEIDLEDQTFSDNGD